MKPITKNSQHDFTKNFPIQKIFLVHLLASRAERFDQSPALPSPADERLQQQLTLRPHVRALIVSWREYT